MGILNLIFFHLGGGFIFYICRMALTRKEKGKVIDEYKKLLQDAKNVIVMEQSSIPVNDVVNLRKWAAVGGGKLKVVKKRLFLRALEESGYENVAREDLSWSVMVLFSLDDEYAPLKSVAKQIKSWQKEGKEFGLKFLGWWYEKAWKDAQFVDTIASMPTKDELLGQFAYLLNYPLQSFAYALDQIAKQKEGEGN